MLPAITTTHAVPRKPTSMHLFPKESAVRCSYCLSVLGNSRDAKARESLLAAHKCSARKLARKPAASVPYN